MPRKFQLSVRRKYEWEKRKQVCSLSVEHIPVTQESISVLHVPQSLTVSIPLDFVLSAKASTLAVLQQRVRTLSVLPPGWFDVSNNPKLLVYCQIDMKDRVTQILLNLEICEDFTWVVRSQGNMIELSDTSLPSTLTTVACVVEAVKFLQSCHFCCGNEDKRFYPLQAERKGMFKDITGLNQVAVYVKDYLPYYTIRSTCCQILLSSSAVRCSQCSEYRKMLNSMLHRFASKGTEVASDSMDPGSHTNYRFLRTPQKNERLRRLRVKAKIRQQQIKRISERLERVIEQNGIRVDDHLHQDLVSTMNEYSPQIYEQHPPGSFQRIFWEQQHQASQLKNSKSMKWEPAMIRWCLYIRHLSGSAYELLRNSGVLKLPSQRTLRDYTYHTCASPGFSVGVDRQLMEAASIESCTYREKHVIIIMDEMHVREGLVYDKHTGQITGFTDLGDTNNHLMAFEKSVKYSEGEESLAKSMLVIMVRGLFSKLRFAYAQFPCSSVKGYLLYDIFWEAVERLERCGFKVLGCTCDGLSVNRRFFKLHGKDKTVYKVNNPYAEDERFLFFFSDPPHLIKTVRNCWASNKRLLWFNGKYIQWSHLRQLYHRCRPIVTSPGLTILPKLKYEHIDLTSFSKMRVDLAAQVLSNSVATALQLTGDPDVEKTAEFVKMFDRMFDCLNVSNLDLGRRSRNAFKSPYHSNKDFRIKWLKEDFLGYLDRWEESVKGRPGFNKTQKNKMLLSQETRLGLRLTVYSFIDMLEYIFTIPDVSVFLSNRICQDPLENFFGQQRQRGRVNENPNVVEFLKNTQALRIINSTCATVRGNCRGQRKDDKPFELENTPLSKRAKKH